MSIGAIVKGLAAPGALIACMCLIGSAQAQTAASADQLKCEQAGGRWTVDASPPVVSADQVVTAREAGSGMATGRVTSPETQQAGGVRVAVGDVNGDGAADSSAAADCKLAIKTKGTSAQRAASPPPSSSGDCDDTDSARTASCSMAINTNGTGAR